MIPKTGFSNGFADVPTKKYYKYHGWVRECNTEPVLPPYREYQNMIPGLYWIKVYDWAGEYNGLKIVKWNITSWLPSSEDDPCPDHFPDGKKRLVFWEYSINHVPIDPPRTSLYTDGLKCTQIMWQMTEDHYYMKSYNTYYFLSSWIMGIAWPAPGSRIRVWKSSTGEFPGYYPI